MDPLASAAARPLRAALVLLALAGSAAASPREARAADVAFSGKAWSDLRFALDANPETGANDFAFIRDESTLKLRVDASLEDRVRAVADVELSYYGFSRLHTLEDLTLREVVDPFRVEMDALYVSISDVGGLKGFDLKLGRQIVSWGTADKFNPTDWLNADDLEDPLMFGENMANQMIRADYAFDEYVLTFVLVPIFRPALLPPSALLGLKDPRTSPLRSIREGLTPLLDLLDTFIGPNGESGSLDVLPRPVVPPTRLDNMQVGGKLAWKILDMDVSLSGYYGFDDLPLPYDVTTTMVSEGGLQRVTSTVEMRYPRYGAAGLDVAGNLPFLADMGFWAEGAVFLPERFTLTIEDVTSDVLGTIPSPAPRVTIVRAVPFFKATVGIDHTPVKWLYFNLQYVYGFIDEFGAGNMQHYLVGGTDVRFKDGLYVLRLFGVWQIPEPTGVIFPQVLIYTFEGLELTVGAFLNLGKEDTKFGNATAGRSNVFLKATATF
jgi:hypothetical protein